MNNLTIYMLLEQLTSKKIKMSRAEHPKLNYATIFGRNTIS